MLKFIEFIAESAKELENSKISYSYLGSQGRSEEFMWSQYKRKLLIKDIKKRKTRVAYRTFSLSEKDWTKKFEDGYTEIGNKNLEKGLTSFTVDKNMLGRFRGGNEVTIIIELKLKEYTEILDTSAYPEEKEILGNNVKWKVTGLDDSTDTWHILGEQITR